MGLTPGTKITDIALDRVFIGSCTNGRIEDLREVAKVVEGKRVAASVNAMIVPGSGIVKMQAEAEGLDKIFKEAGFDWREPGCSMCLAMNADRLAPHERCASTSNRNFEGRQGFKGRTHLVSPAMAAAAAIAGASWTSARFDIIFGHDKCSWPILSLCSRFCWRGSAFARSGMTLPGNTPGNAPRSKSSSKNSRYLRQYPRLRSGFPR